MIPTLILAAGGSTRLGSPKQLLPFQGSTLVRLAAIRALALKAGPVLVVVGSENARVENEIKDLNLHWILNPEWERGIGSSLRTGVEALLQKYPGSEGLLMMLCDQPRIPHSAYAELLGKFKDQPCSVVASRYQDALGVPAVFPKRFLNRMKHLDDGEGAKPLLKKLEREEPGFVLGVPLREAAFDVDTPDDYQELLESRVPSLLAEPPDRA